MIQNVDGKLAKLCGNIERGSINVKNLNHVSCAKQWSVECMHHRVFEQNEATALAHLRWVGDFLELGEGVWYRIHKTAIELLDGHLHKLCGTTYSPPQTCGYADDRCECWKLPIFFARTCKRWSCCRRLSNTRSVSSLAAWSVATTHSGQAMR